MTKIWMTTPKFKTKAGTYPLGKKNKNKNQSGSAFSDAAWTGGSHDSWDGKHSSSSYGEHGPAEHKVVQIYKGTIQATNGEDLRENFKAYDLSVFLNERTIERLMNEIPFSLGFPSPATKNKVLLYAFHDQHAPKNDYFFQWVLKALLTELKKGAHIGIACHGGHGRTGTILACLWGLANLDSKGVPKMNPILAIRELVGCTREVESKVQEIFIYEVTNYPAPEVSVFFKDFFFSDSGDGWYDEKGAQFSPLQNEPNLYEKIDEMRILVLRDKSPIDETYILSEGWMIPLRVGKNETPNPGNRMPKYLCDKCQCALGYLTPYTKGDKKVCVVEAKFTTRGIKYGLNPALVKIKEEGPKVTPKNCAEMEWKCNLLNPCPRHEEFMKSPAKALPAGKTEVTTNKNATVADCPSGYLYCSFEEPCNRHLEMGIYNTKKIAPPTIIDPSKLDDHCDDCAKSLDLKIYVTALIDGEPYQFCDTQCKDTFILWVKPKLVDGHAVKIVDKEIKYLSIEDKNIHDKVLDLVNKFNGKKVD